jgi:hypothetical protein
LATCDFRNGRGHPVPKIAEEARAARRDQIIAAAAECFARSGYHVTTMADIAEAPGKPAVALRPGSAAVPGGLLGDAEGAWG